MWTSLLILLQTYREKKNRKRGIVDTLLTCLPYQIHLFLPQLCNVCPLQTHIWDSLLLWIHMSSHLFASNTSYLQDSCLISSRQDTTTGALRLQFLLLNATQDFLLLLLKLDYYQFPSPPNHLTYIPEVRAWLFVGFVGFFSISSVHSH